jgi:hypothetical protein
MALGFNKSKLWSELMYEGDIKNTCTFHTPFSQRVEMFNVTHRAAIHTFFSFAYDKSQ